MAEDDEIPEYLKWLPPPTNEDPNFKYELHGQFDFESYDRDLENFPDWFDENGWPLFGNYDPLALIHPITGLEWYYSPRLPTDEDDDEYQTWYELAETFQSINYQIFEVLRNRPKVAKEIPALSDEFHAVYNIESHFAVAGNLDFLSSQTFPELKQLFSERKHTLEFSRLWGEFRKIAAELGIAAEQSVLRVKQRTGGQQSARSAQRKWCLHWRRHYKETLGKTVNTANKDLLDIAWKIHRQKITPPNGFDIEWFEKVLGQEKDMNTGELIPVRKLSNFTARVLKHADYEKLLDSLPEDTPAIPPVGLEYYK